MRPRPTAAKWGLGLLLAAVAVGVVAGPPAEARPTQPAIPQECDPDPVQVSMYRSMYSLPEELPAGTQLEDMDAYGSPVVGNYDLYDPDCEHYYGLLPDGVGLQFVVAYNMGEDGVWHLVEDNLRTSQDREIPDGQCVDVSPRRNLQEAVPERLPLDELDQWLHMDIFGEATNPEPYCREGDEFVVEWALESPPGGEQGEDDSVIEGVEYPEGHYSEWAEECMSFLAGDYPAEMKQRGWRTITSPERPDNVGGYTYQEDVNVILERMIEEDGEDAAKRWIRGGLNRTDIQESVTYCRQGDTWYRIDDYDLLAELQEQYGTIPRIDCDVDEDVVDVTFIFIPNTCWGPYPTQNYDLSHDTTTHSVPLLPDGLNPANWNPVRLFNGLMMDIFFFATKAFIAIPLFLLDWAFTYDFTQWFDHFIGFGERYQVGVVEGLDLADIAWFILLVWAGMTALRGRTGKAAAEILMSMVMWGLALTLLLSTASYTDYLRSAINAIDEMSLIVLAAASDEDDDVIVEDVGDDQEARAANAREIIEPFQATLHKAFVEEPYDYLQWGRSIPEGDECADARDFVLQEGSDMGAEERQNAMSNAGCEEEAAHHALATEGRTFGAFVSAVVASLVLYSVAVLAIGIVMSKYIVAFLFVVVPFAAVLGVLPGGGRRLAFLWLSTLIQMILSVVLLTFFLSFILIGTDIVVETTSADNMAERWILMLVVFFTAMSIRRSLMDGTRNLVGSMTGGLQRLTPGGAASAARRPDGPAGYDFNRGIDRTVGGAGRLAHTGALVGAIGAGALLETASGAVGTAANTIPERLREKRVAHRAYRNLEKIQHSVRGFDGPGFQEVGRSSPGAGKGGGGGLRGLWRRVTGRPEVGRRAAIRGGVPSNLPTRHRPVVSLRHPVRDSRLFHPVRAHRENRAVRGHLRDVEHMHVPTKWEHFSHPFRTRRDLKEHRTALARRQSQTQIARRVPRRRGGPGARTRLYDKQGKRFR